MQRHESSRRCNRTEIRSLKWLAPIDQLAIDRQPVACDHSCRRLCNQFAMDGVALAASFNSHSFMILTMHNQRSFIDHLSLFGIYLNYSRPKRYFRISVQILSPAKYLFNWPVCCNYINLFSLSPSLSSIDDRDLFTESTSPRGMHHQICG